MQIAEPKLSIQVSREGIVAFCEKWKIQELSFFGSVVREDFGPDSDIDVLVRFLPSARWTLFDQADAQDELAELLGRKVDILNKCAVERSHNEFRRAAILGDAKIYYCHEEAA